MQLNVRKYFNLIELSENNQPLSENLQSRLLPLLQYEKKEILRGYAAQDRVTGERTPIRLTPTLHYRFDKNGRLQCQRGFLRDITAIAEEAGYVVTVTDVTPRFRDPDVLYIDRTNVERAVTFRALQDSIVEAMISQPMGIIQWPPRVGKSVGIVTGCLLFPAAKIVVVSPRVTITANLVRELTSYFPMVGHVDGSHNEFGRITVTTIQSTHKCGQPDIVFVDEPHLCVTDKGAESLTNLTQRADRVYGFDATPTGRADNTDSRVTAIFGPVIHHISRSAAIANKLVLPVLVIWHHVRLTANPAQGREGTPKERWGLWRNTPRHRIIADVANLYAADVQVLILVSKLEHAVYLSKWLPDFTLVYANADVKKWRQWVAKGLVEDDSRIANVADRMALQTRFESGELKKVIATSTWDTGVNFKHLSVLIRANAAGGSTITDEQSPNRAATLDPESGKMVAIVHDFYDDFEKTFNWRAKDRKRNYKKLGYTQIDYDKDPLYG